MPSPKSALRLTDPQYEQALLTASCIFHTFKCTPEHLHTPATKLGEIIVKKHLRDLCGNSKELLEPMRLLIPHVARQQAVIERECPVFK